MYRHPKLSDDLILFLKLGNGCGGAAIINGRLLRGTSGVATEFGHMRVADDGPHCHCGQTGCLETHVNLAALARYLAEEGADVAADPELVAQAVRNGQAPAVAAVRRLEAYLAIGMVNLANIFNPSDIVLGGAMRPVLELCLDRLRQAVAERHRCRASSRLRSRCRRTICSNAPSAPPLLLTINSSTRQPFHWQGPATLAQAAAPLPEWPRKVAIARSGPDNGG